MKIKRRGQGSDKERQVDYINPERERKGTKIKRIIPQRKNKRNNRCREIEKEIILMKRD